MHKNILVIGAGNFGTSLAQHLATLGNEVMLWARTPFVADAIDTTHRNPKYLSTITLSERIRARSILDEELVQGARMIVLAVPTHVLRAMLQQIRQWLGPDHLLGWGAKGIEHETLALPHSICYDTLNAIGGKRPRVALLSGPSFAEEVIRHQPTCVTAASFDPEVAAAAQLEFHSPNFRVYTSPDPIGVSVGGALKNVIAIAAGAANGLGLGWNSLAALITRGLSEITRCGVALGADPLTFTGLSGVGDLFLTCTSEKSRNFRVGLGLGRGHVLSEILGSLGSTSEGVSTARAAYVLAEQIGVSMPICTAAHFVLTGQTSVADALTGLLHREAKSELDFPAHTSARRAPGTT